VKPQVAAETKGLRVKTKALILGFVGGVLGAALIFGVFLVIGSPFVKTETTQIVQSAPATFASPGVGLTPEQIYQQATPSVVEVQSTFPSIQGFFGQQGEGHGIGTGFVVSSKGEILTNAHVVVVYQDDTGAYLSTPQPATKVQVVFKGSGSKTTTVDATVVGVDGASDVALLKVDPGKVPNLRPLPLGDSARSRSASRWSPSGIPRPRVHHDLGIVSAINRPLSRSPTRAAIENGIQTDAAINEGNSGGSSTPRPRHRHQRTDRHGEKRGQRQHRAGIRGAHQRPSHR
jgi:S1-C subfamily serine protease